MHFTTFPDSRPELTSTDAVILDFYSHLVKVKRGRVGWKPEEKVEIRCDSISCVEQAISIEQYPTVKEARVNQRHPAGQPRKFEAMPDGFLQPKGRVTKVRAAAYKVETVVADG